MVKSIGLLLGTLMLVDGAINTINPRWGFGIWERNLKGYLPESLNRITREYAHLSDTALRYVTVWEVLTGLVLLWLATRVRH